MNMALTTLTKSFSAITIGRQYIPVCSIGTPPTKDLQPAAAPAYYRLGLLSYPNVRKSSDDSTCANRTPQRESRLIVFNSEHKSSCKGVVMPI